MKFEKLNEDKIRIILDIKDLKEKDIDYQSFMSNSVDTQKLFLDMLQEAEEKIGFETKDYKIMIEALVTSDGNFVVTVTRSQPNDIDNTKKKNLKVSRKSSNINNNQAIYLFNSFDDFCTFCSSLEKNTFENLNNFSKYMSLYLYNNTYYLLINNINLEYKYLKQFNYSISEFAKFINNSDIFEFKLKEYGNLIIKNTAIKTCLKFF